MNETRTKTMLNIPSNGEIELVGPPDLLIAENRALREALHAERDARRKMIKLIDEIVDEYDPQLRDTVMIRLGVEGLLAIRAER